MKALSTIAALGLLFGTISHASAQSPRDLLGQLLQAGARHASPGPGLSTRKVTTASGVQRGGQSTRFRMPNWGGNPYWNGPYRGTPSWQQILPIIGGGQWPGPGGGWTPPGGGGGVVLPPPPPPTCVTYLVYYYHHCHGWTFYGRYNSHYRASAAVSSLQQQGYRAYMKRTQR